MSSIWSALLCCFVLRVPLTLRVEADVTVVIPPLRRELPGLLKHPHPVLPANCTAGAQLKMEDVEPLLSK